MPFRRLFLSRWSALLWAGGVLWFTCDIAGPSAGGTPAAGGNVAETADFDAIAAAMANAS